MTLPAQDIVERLFEDIRNRRFLKWLFPEFEGAGPILHDQYGDPLMPFDLDVQEEIKAAWAAIIGHTISHLTADNEALRKERDEARASHHRTSHKAVKRLRALWREKQAAESRADTLAHRVERLEAALRDQFCPRPCNGRPDKFDVGDCVDAGECGCSARAALTGERP